MSGVGDIRGCGILTQGKPATASSSASHPTAALPATRLVTIWAAISVWQLKFTIRRIHGNSRSSKEGVLASESKTLHKRMQSLREYRADANTNSYSSTAICRNLRANALLVPNHAGTTLRQGLPKY